MRSFMHDGSNTKFSPIGSNTTFSPVSNTATRSLLHRSIACDHLWVQTCDATTCGFKNVTVSPTTRCKRSTPPTCTSKKQPRKPSGEVHRKDTQHTALKEDHGTPARTNTGDRRVTQAETREETSTSQVPIAENVP